jgi:hypothetical protein
MNIAPAPESAITRGDDVLFFLDMAECNKQRGDQQ